MTALELIRINLNAAHDQFSETVADVTQEMADWLPPGVMHPIGERYAHTIGAEDWLVHSIVQGGAPWFVSTWAGRTGFGKTSELRFDFTAEQARAFHVDDLSALHEYERAVFASTREYLASIDESAMERGFDMPKAGLHQIPAPAWWSGFVIGHLHDLMGEISALKGCLGAKGYPF